MISLLSTWRRTVGLIACLFCAITFMQAQTYWNKTYLADRAVMTFSSIVANGDSFILTGNTYGSFIQRNKTILSNIALNGDLTRLQILMDSDAVEYGAFWNSLIKTENGYAFTGYAYDTARYIILGIVDNQLSGIKIYKYYTANAYAFQGRGLIEKNGSYYICGVLTDDTQNDPNVFLAKIDSAGNRLWQKTYGLPNWLEESFSLTELNNGNLIIGAARLNINVVPEIAHTWLIEVDTDGIVKRQWLDPNDSTYAPYAIKQTADGGFVYGCQKKVYQNGSTITYVNKITKLNPGTTFTKLWTYEEGEHSTFNNVTDVELLANGDILACGHSCSLYYDTTVVYAWVAKLNAQGSYKWSGYFAANTAGTTLNFLNDVDVLPDGSIIAVGEFQGRGNGPVQVGWFLKLDSNGCEVENCLVGLEDDKRQAIDDRQIQVQPNPATGTVQLTIDNEMLGSTISLYNITGALILQQTAEAEKTQLNLAALSKGMYVVTVQKQNTTARSKLVVE